MKALNPGTAAHGAVSAAAGRPATAILLDTPDVRLVIFRLEAGQVVKPHSNPSTVLLSVVKGEGFVSGGDGEQAATSGDVFACEPNELHGFRATDGELHVLATIAPRPGSR